MKLQHFSTCLVAGLFFSCAGAPVAKIQDDGKLPQELTKEQAERFEVREAPPTPTPTPSPNTDDGGKGKKKKKKGKATKVVGAPEGFPYPQRRPGVDPIWPGEKSVFSISYFGMAAGDFTLEVLPYQAINSRKVYHVRGTAVSSKVFSLFYRLNDTVETFFDFDGLFSHRFHLILDESKQTRDALELNDSERRQTFYWNRWNHRDKGYKETKEFFEIPSFPQDSLSMIYYLRSVPLPDGAVVTVPVVSEGKTWEAVLTVVRREEVRTPLGKIMAVVVKPETKYQGVLQKRGDSFLWLTDDERRFVLRLEAKIRVGTVVAELREIEKGTPPAPASGSASEPPGGTITATQ